MPWVVGIDEAGYGPNLGPLVQAAVALRLPDGDPSGWESLRPVVRRCGEKADGRLLIDDSKAVYTRHGLAALERGVQAALVLMESTVGDLLRRTALPTPPRLRWRSMVPYPWRAARLAFISITGTSALGRKRTSY